MRAKFTIAVCALLMLGLAVTQVHAQGFVVSKAETDVVEGGRNQMMGSIRLDYVETGGSIDDGRTIKITYDNLYITSTSANVTAALMCEGFSCGTDAGEVDAEVANDDDTGVGTVTINMGTNRPATGDRYVIVRQVRADVSSLSVGDTIAAAVNSATAPSGFVPIGQDRTESVGGVVSTVKDGLDVKVGSASRLLCNIGEITTDDGGTPTDTSDDTTVPIGGVPSITVSEGFAKAWEHTGAAPGAGNAGVGQTMVSIQMNSLPDGVNLRWPHVVNFIDPNDGGTLTWSTLTLTDASRRAAGRINTTTTMGAGVEDNTDTTDDADDVYAASNGAMVTYTYATTSAGRTGASDKTVDTEMDSFKIEFDVDVDDLEKVGAGGISDIWAWLGPEGKSGDDDDRSTVLSYVKMPDTDPDVEMGDIINFGECVTYLLFPYLTCGNDDNWDTAIAIANTTMDDGVFGLSAGAAAQSGSIMLHTFPQSGLMMDGGMMDDGAMGGMYMMPDSVTIAEDVAAGDTHAFTCSNEIPGFAGYAIARAGFRHAHGVAFVLGMFDGGAVIDLAHGYLALVIPDPEFDNRGRGAASGETLGQ